MATDTLVMSPKHQVEQLHFVPDEYGITVITDATIMPNPDTTKRIYDALQTAIASVGLVPGAPLVRKNAPIINYLPLVRGGTKVHLYFRRPPLGDDASLQDRLEALKGFVTLANFRLIVRPGGGEPTLKNFFPPSDQSDWSGDLTITAVTPNWIGVGCGSGGEGVGPASPPEPVDQDDPHIARNWQFKFVSGDGRFGNARLQGYVEDERRIAAGDTEDPKVVVAVLDTCPENGVISRAIGKFTHNTLLNQIGDPLVAGTGVHTKPVEVNGTLPPRLAGTAVTAEEMQIDYDHLRGIVPTWTGRMGDWFGAVDGAGIPDYAALVRIRHEHYAMPDHGLFIAGIIKDIAPLAEIHLVRAAEEAGTTELPIFAETIRRVLNQPWANDPAKRLIISLSLAFTIPTYDEFVSGWAPVLPTDATLAEKARLHGLIHRNLQDVIDRIVERGALVVAAAGNNNDPNQLSRPQPHFPAHYDNVFSVAALTRERAPSSYTNRADDPASAAGNGIATLGGDVVWPADPNRPGGVVPRVQVEQRAGLEWWEGPDAIFGLCSAIDLPHGNPSATGTAIGDGENKTGWILWVGTSFATPIIAAVAAVLWRRTWGNDATQARDDVKTYHDTAISWSGELGSGDTIYAEQEMIVTTIP